MVSHQFFYELALVAIIWLFVLLHLTGSKPSLTTRPMAAKPKRKRSTEPKAFQGLTQKPAFPVHRRNFVCQIRIAFVNNHLQALAGTGSV
jgi:hypothetical protein